MAEGMKNVTDCADERTFYYTGTLQNLTVPDDPLITGMAVEMWGAGGGGAVAGVVAGGVGRGDGDEGENRGKRKGELHAL